MWPFHKRAINGRTHLLGLESKAPTEPQKGKQMSFLSIMKTVGKDALLGANAAAPALNLFAPGIGSAIGGLTSLVITAENKFPDPKSGPQKKDWVLTAVQVGLPFFQEILKEHGELLTIDAQALSDTIDDIVGLFNSAQKLHASFSLQKV